MKIFYWSPFLSNIATIDAVLKSIKSITSFDKKSEFEPCIIDAVGEWAQKTDKIEKINIKKLYQKNIYTHLPKGGYFQSRVSQSLIFIMSFIRLKKLIFKEKPEYLIAHLIISLPLLLFSIYNFESKLIIRISGTPKLNFVRKFFWKIFSKNIYKVTCPTISAYDNLKNLKIFPDSKLEILYDPIISIQEIKKKKYEKLDERFLKDEFILSIGRLTKQKNFQLLIRSFFKISEKIPEIKLIILGEGEDRFKLEKLIRKLRLDNKVFLLGHKSNVFNYLYNAKCFISSSLYEDPGFVIIEAGFLNKVVFAADSNTGPSEILDMSRRGFLFKNNNHDDLTKKYLDFVKLDTSEVKKKIINLKKYSKLFSSFSHFKNLKKILVN
jgi:glycosyltransferase involved in cell wall biosynthesis